VLKLEDNPSIPPVALGDSSLIKIGEPVVAIGSPFELPDTLTAGIISQVNRTETIEDRTTPNLLQFDAPVNPGNSGGPLANATGEFIGLVIARISASTGDGIYYAVSSNKVKRVAAAIINEGSFPYPQIGIGVVDLTPQDVQERSLDSINGVLVVSVTAGEPAQAAGIRVNDIIVAMDGVPVRNYDELTSYLGEFKSPGDTALIEVIRGSSRLEISLVVGAR
jgi:S1-C subfamily serine protease